MPVAADTLLEETRCLGCNSEASEAALLKLGLWQRLASLTDVDEIVDSFVERSGISDQTQIDAVSQLVLSSRVHGWWNKCDLIYPYVGGTAGAHSQNLKSSSFPITWNGTVTHDANGVTGDGTTGYGDTGYIPASSGLMLLNSTHIGVYRRTTGTLNGRAYLSARNLLTSERLELSIAVTDTTMNAAANSSFTSYLLTSLAWTAVSRTVPSEFHFFNGGTDTASALISTVSPAVSLYVLAQNNDGVVAQLSEANLAFATAGSGITFAEYQQMASDIQTFQTALGRAV